MKQLSKYDHTTLVIQNNFNCSKYVQCLFCGQHNVPLLSGSKIQTDWNCEQFILSICLDYQTKPRNMAKPSSKLVFSCSAPQSESSRGNGTIFLHCPFFIFKFQNVLQSKILVVVKCGMWFIFCYKTENKNYSGTVNIYRNNVMTEKALNSGIVKGFLSSFHQLWRAGRQSQCSDVHSSLHHEHLVCHF